MSFKTTSVIEKTQLNDGFMQTFVDDVFNNCQEIQAKTNAFTYLDKNFIDAQVVEIQKRLDQSESLPFAGVPIGVKDNILVKDIPCSCGSNILNGFIAPYDAHVVENLKRNGAIIIGKMNMDEFAMGSSSERSNTGAVRNPHDISRVAGGSSGGSAAAVAAGALRLTLGTDTGGSIRQPASFCGTVGFKPTYGAVSRYGLVSYGSSLDQIGPFAPTVDEAAELFRVIQGRDLRDSTSRLLKEKLEISETSKIACLSLDSLIGLSDEVIDNYHQSVDSLKNQGYTCEFISLDQLEQMIGIYYLVATAEASANLARFDGVRFGSRASDTNLASLYEESRSKGFGFEVKKRIMLGTFVLSSGYYDAYYKKAQNARRALSQSFAKVFNSYELFCLPTAPTAAFKIGAQIKDPIEMYLSDLFTVFANLVGGPALSIPSGKGQDSGLPLGFQIAASPGKDFLLLHHGQKIQNILEKSAS